MVLMIGIDSIAGLGGEEEDEDKEEEDETAAVVVLKDSAAYLVGWEQWTEAVFAFC